MDFEWDDAKALANLSKHGIPFEEALAVFHDERRLDYDASRSAGGEERRKAVGVLGPWIVAVVYTIRGSACRIISARRANTTEEKRYGDRPQQG
jgi:uncharacterized DUF497 family protein